MNTTFLRIKAWPPLAVASRQALYRCLRLKFRGRRAPPPQGSAAPPPDDEERQRLRLSGSGSYMCAACTQLACECQLLWRSAKHTSANIAQPGCTARMSPLMLLVLAAVSAASACRLLFEAHANSEVDARRLASDSDASEVSTLARVGVSVRIGKCTREICAKTRRAPGAGRRVSSSSARRSETHDD